MRGVQQKGTDKNVCPTQTSEIHFQGRSDKELFFLLLARLVALAATAARPQKIKPHLNPLHQSRRFLNRSPKTVTELRARILNGLKRPRQNAVGMQQLSAKPVRGVRENAVDLLRLPARQIHDVRRVIHHVGDFRLCVGEKNLRARKYRPTPRMQDTHTSIHLRHHSEQTKILPSPTPPARRGNTSPWNPHCPP